MKRVSRLLGRGRRSTDSGVGESLLRHEGSSIASTYTSPFAIPAHVDGAARGDPDAGRWAVPDISEEPNCVSPSSSGVGGTADSGGAPNSGALGISGLRLEEAECSAIEVRLRLTLAEAEDLRASDARLEGEAADLAVELAAARCQEREFEEEGQLRSVSAHAASERAARVQQEIGATTDEIGCLRRQVADCARERRAAESREEEVAWEAVASERRALEALQAAGRREHEELCIARSAASEAQLELEAERDAAERSRGAVAESEAEAALVAAAIRRAQAAAQERESTYWDEAPFLRVSAEDLRELRGRLAAKRRQLRGLEASLAREAVGQEPRPAPGPREDPPATPPGNGPAAAAAGGSPRPTAWSAGTASPPPSASSTPRPAGEAEAAAASPPRRRLHSSRTPVASPPPSPARAVLLTLEAENRRLHRRVKELRGLVEKLAPPGRAGGSDDVDGFAAAVAGTGARVIDQMKQALHEDTELLRSLHARKWELDQRCRHERRLHAALHRQLAAAVL